MINVKYYLNGQVLYGFSEEIATVDNLYDFIGTKENTIVPLMDKQFISKGAVYNLFTNTLEIVLVNKVKFTHDIFVPNCPEHLIEQLEYIGYVKSELSGVGNNLITNGTQGKYYFTDNDYSNGGMGYVCDKPDVALAIAAIRNDSDKYQWFMFPDKEYEFCENDNVIEEYGEFENTIYPKKLTPEEIYQIF